MKIRIFTEGGFLRWTFLFLFSAAVYAQSPPVITTSTPTVMTILASGSFEVKLTPLTPDEESGDSSLGSMMIDKQFYGDLTAHSKGQMLTAMTAVEGSAGYVAVERVSGKLHGRDGTFVLQHSGTMARGVQQQTVSVVPDSGTGELEGLSGEMKITISEGKHFYELKYTLDSGP